MKSLSRALCKSLITRLMTDAVRSTSDSERTSAFLSRYVLEGCYLRDATHGFEELADVVLLPVPVLPIHVECRLLSESGVQLSVLNSASAFAA
jgi:hypothetical protein